ncbi:DUF4058 family protein [Roseofilum sp. Guam]
MPSPFSGMNPYLEHSDLWPGVHHWLIIELALRGSLRKGESNMRVSAIKF